MVNVTPYSEGEDSIRIGVSRVANRLVYDRQIVSSVGIETYCRLQQKSPELYTPLIECGKFDLHPSDIEGTLLDVETRPEQIKKEIIQTVLGNTPSHVAAKLVGSSPPPADPYYHTSWIADFFFYAWLILMVCLLVWYLINSRLLNHLSPNSGSILDHLIWDL